MPFRLPQQAWRCPLKADSNGNARSSIGRGEQVHALLSVPEVSEVSAVSAEGRSYAPEVDPLSMGCAGEFR